MASKPYRPSNGTEGMGFVEVWCDRCIKMSIDPNAKKQCSFFLRSQIDYDHNGKWFEIDGVPTCTAFKSRTEYNRTRKRYGRRDERQTEMF